MLDLLVRYCHFLGIIVLGAMLVVEHVAFKPVMSGREMRKMFLYDGLVGLSAVVVFLAGLSLWFWVGKPAEFYTKNPLMHIKFTLFILMFLFSLIPTFFILKHRRSEAEEITVPKRVIMMIRAELLLLFLIPILGVLMAAGVGLR